MDGSMMLVPPAPRVHEKPLPNWRALMAMMRDPLTVYSERDFEQRGSRVRFLGITSIGVNEPESVRHVLTTAASKYRRAAVATRPFRWVLGNGLLLAEGEEWRRQRRMLAPVFSPAQVGSMLPHFHDAAAAMLGRLEGRAQCNLSAEFNGATLDSLLRALFSTPADTHGAELAGYVRNYLHGPGRPNLADAVAKKEGDYAIFDGPRRRFRARWFATVDALVATRRRRGPTEATRDLLDVLLAVRDQDNGAPLPPEEVRDQAATMLFAGFETTTQLLFWAAYLLTLDTGEQSAIRGEIVDFAPGRVASLEDLENWPRLKRTLLEALRLYPPIPLLVRQAVEPDELGGETVKPGDLVWMSPWTLHRHRQYWKQPTAFMPDRFINQPHPWTQGAFMPFGGGPRICIGASFAMAEAQILLATLLERYWIEIIDRRPVMPTGLVTTKPDYEPTFALLDHHV